MGPLARPWALPARDGARACDISVRRIGGRRAAVGFSPAGRARGWRSVRALGVGKEPDHEPTTTGRDAARDADVPSTSVGGGGARVAMTPDKAAALRLRSLVANIGDGETELVNQELRELDPSIKVLLCIVAGSLVLSGASVICYLVGASPLGGATLSLDSLAAAVTGIVAGAPFAGVRSVMWGKEVRTKLPAVDFLLMQEFDYFEPILTGMSSWQVAVVLMAEVLPPLVMVLPTAQAGLSETYAAYASDIFNGVLGLNVDVPAVSETLALLTTAALAAIGQLLNVKVSRREVDAIQEAMVNADRYYRLMATGPGLGPTQWRDMSQAFKNVARKYLEAMESAAQLSGMLTAGEVIYLGLLWQATGDLWAPFAASMMVLGVDIAQMRRIIAKDTSL